MSRKLIACVAVFAVAVAAVLAGTALAARSSAKANGCCYPGSECCYPGSPCCEADCCYEGSPCCDPARACCLAASAAAKAKANCCEPGAECCFPGSPCCGGDDCCFPGSPCCYPGSPCCGDCCVEGAACCTGKAACCTAAFTSAVADEAAAPAAGVTVIAVEDMDCPSCAKKVVAKLNEVPGVGKVEADTKESKLTVTPKGKAAPSAKAMWEAVEKAGYKPTRLEGPAGKFTASPKE